MQIDKVTLVNFCQHDATYTFGDGVWAVIGPNGSGKSNLLGGIFYALTGRNPHKGQKMDNIRTNAPEEAASYVVLEFTQHGKKYKLRRNIRPASPSAVLAFDGQKITGSDNVHGMLEGIIGAPLSVVERVLFARQHELFGVLDQTPSSRLAMLSQLFGLSRADSINRRIRAWVNNLPEYAEQPVDDLRRERAELESEYEQLCAQQALLTPPKDINALQKEYDKLRQMEVDRKQAFERYTTLLEEYKVAESEYDDCMKELLRLQKQRSEYADAPSDATIARCRAEYDQAVRKEAEYQAQVRAQSERQRKLEELQQRLESIKDPDEPCPDSAVVEELLARQRELKSQIGMFDKVLSSQLRDTCPTCGTPESVYSTYRDEVRSRREEAAAELADINTRLDKMLRLRMKWEDVRSKRSETEREIDALPDISNNATLPEKSSAEWANELRELEGRQDAANNFKRQLHQAQHALERAERTMQRLSRFINDTNTRLENTPVPDETRMHELEKEIQLHRSSLEPWHELETKINVVRTKLDALDTRISEAMETRRKSHKARQIRAVLSRMKSYFDVSGVPSYVIKKNLSELSGILNMYLEMFDTPFRVEISNEMEFVAVFDATGVRQQANRLSGGQRVVLALAFRLALLTAWAPQAGLLVLDEPTAYLDEQNIKGFGRLMERLRQLSKSGDLQAIVATHESALAPLFDGKVEING